MFAKLIDTQYIPTLSISEERFEVDNVTVTVEWAPAQQDGVMYTVNISPLVAKRDIYVRGTRCQLTIPYNAVHNLSVIAAVPCRPNATAVITLHYGKV